MRAIWVRGDINYSMGQDPMSFWQCGLQHVICTSIFLQGEGWLFCALVLFSSVPPSLTSPSSHQFRQCGGCLLPYAPTQGLMTGFSRFASHGTNRHLVDKSLSISQERFNNILVSE